MTFCTCQIEAGVVVAVCAVHQVMVEDVVRHAIKSTKAEIVERFERQGIQKAIDAVKALKSFYDDWGDVCLERDEVLEALEALRPAPAAPTEPTT